VTDVEKDVEIDEKAKGIMPPNRCLECHKMLTSVRQDAGVASTRARSRHNMRIRSVVAFRQLR
jgi:hypothetical protein